MAQIIIIEDEALLAKSLARSLISHGHDCVTAIRAEDGLRLMEQTPMDLALIDLQLPGMTGFDAMTKIRQLDSNIAVIVITAYGTMASVVEAMRSGASDFLRKPIDTEELALAVDSALENARLKHTIDYYQTKEIEKTDENKIISNSSGMKKVSDILEKLSNMNLPSSSDYPPVLVLGETGTGKDLIVRNVHYHSSYSHKPFVEVNCSSLPKGLEEAELFGYEKGAFTGAHRSKRGLFETADEGTLFLNEIGDLNPEAQVKLLSVIENKCLRRVGGLRDIAIDVRIIAATNRNLEDKNIFREDLYHRLNNLSIEIPPLRERKDDIMPLAELFLQKFCHKYNVEKSFSEKAKETMLDYSWPGNVRELRQLIERTTFLSTGPVIEADNLNLPQQHKTTLSVNRKSEIKIDMPKEGIRLDTIEREIIIKTLKVSGGNVSETARKLGIGREAMRYRIKKYSLSKLLK